MSAAAGKAIALVQGASRGIGLQFARVLSQRENFQVVAVSRFPEKSEELKALAHVDIRPVDVSKENEIEDLARYVKQEYGKMDLIINSSAMLHPSGTFRHLTV